ncbi:hypothetical protein B0H67DRAFT_578623 [Lasiosphaeris hirsuta]|uniref:RRN7-type domain-containing protein n=1 Tax=Lasiosphaeris hirsuta TaxID=260670 RepID=A0AA40AEX8_9PEZI|nr:hypothetical protein B0H67DRAFT_578623 [Lasiosphaeris hirsuta]
MRQHHRFPRGETCTDCPARRWYLENGFRYCENGHQVEGYVQFDVDEHDNFGKTGKTARKEKAVREKERKQLSGSEAKELYLECLQLILRKQVAWLIARQDVHPELELVCRNLWDLRIRGFVGLTPAKTKGKGKAGVGMPPRSQSGPDAGLVMFSSQAAAQILPEDDAKTRALKKRRWKTKTWQGEYWSLPGPMDILALVYLGCLLRQEPLMIGDIYRWAKTNQIPYLGALESVPKDWRERLPSWAQRVLLTRYTKFEGSELHKAVLELVLGYKENYSMVFPAIPVPQLLLSWVKYLALPPDVFHHVQQLCNLAETSFLFPTRKAKREEAEKSKHGGYVKYFMIDIPDVLLVAAVVAVTRLMYSLDGIERFPRDSSDPLALKMDWAVWESEFAAPPEIDRGRLEFQNLDPEEIWTMRKDEIIEYLNWFQTIHGIDIQRSAETDIHRLFPLEEITPLPEGHDISEEEIEARMKRVQNAMTRVEQRPEPVDGDDKNVKRLGYRYQPFRDHRHLSGPAKRFYQVAAEASGLSLEDLIAAVFRLERMMLALEKEERMRMLGDVTKEGVDQDDIDLEDGHEEA